MELLSQVSNTQFLFPAAAVAVVLVCAALVFMLGFSTAEQPQFDKLPLVIDDRKSSNKKRKPKEKKSSPNRAATEDAKAKSESSKKSPTKEKREEKVKEAEKPKPKSEKLPDNKPVKKDPTMEAKKGKKGRAAEAEKPADFDDGGWQEVPKKSQKKVKSPEEKEKDKKESPAKKNKRKNKDADVEAGRPADDSSEETIKVVSIKGPSVDEEAARALQAQVEELQRVLKERERQDQAALGGSEDDVEDGSGDVKDLRSTKRNQIKEKQTKKKATEAATLAKNALKEQDSSDTSDKQDDKPNVPVFDELGDTWSDTKAKKGGKKKARKDQ